MEYVDLDPDLAIWGVASQSAEGPRISVCRSLSAAEVAAETAPRLTITGRHPLTGVHRIIPDVWPLVYRNSDHGWMLAGIGWPILAA